MNKAYTQTSGKCLRKRTHNQPTPYFSTQVLKIAKKKSEDLKNNKNYEYKRFNEIIKNKKKVDKRAWFEKKCAKIEKANA